MPSHLAKKRALIVNDQRDELASLRGMLTQLGFETIAVASSVNMAMSILREQSFDVVFVCYELGKNEKNGLQVLQEAQAERLHLFTTLFVLVVDVNEANLLVGALDVAPNAYLSKPLQHAKVAATLDKLVRLKKVTIKLDQAMDAEQWEEAIAHCHSLIAAYPALNVYVERLLGVCLLSSGQVEEAHNLFSALAAVRKTPWAQVGVGIALCRLGKAEAAVAVLQRVIDKHAVSVEACCWLARSLWMSGHRGEAVNCMRKAALLQPTMSSLHSELGNISAWNGEWSVAKKAFQQSIDYSRYTVFHNVDDYYAFVASILTEQKSQPLSEATAWDIIRTMEAVLRDTENDIEAQFRAHLALASFRQHLAHDELMMSECELAISTYEKLPLERQWYWIEPFLDEISGTVYEPKVRSYRKKLIDKVQHIPWVSYHQIARAAQANHQYVEALYSMISAALYPQSSIQVKLDTFQLLAEQLQSDAAFFIEPDVVAFLHQIEQLNFAACSPKQRIRYQALYQKYSEIRQAADILPVK